MANNSICSLLATYPINFPVMSIIINGRRQTVTSFTSFNSETSIGYFNDAGSTIVADCSKISLIEL
ncbi:hypothetical protein [Sporosarcina sp. UB5]|uniref:hypothetical protein n=1 Tax=Sporosarcina sp. UB5 TaxID=3047463 RepID=UPI003D7B9532